MKKRVSFAYLFRLGFVLCFLGFALAGNVVALAQGPDGGDLTADGSGVLTEPSPELQQGDVPALAAVDCTPGVNNLIALDVSNGTDVTEYRKLTADVNALGYTVGTVNVATEGVPFCVDHLIIASQRFNSCLTSAYSTTTIETVRSAVQGGVNLLLMNEHTSCGAGTVGLANAFGATPNRDSFASVLSAGKNFSQGTPPILFDRVQTWYEVAATTYTASSGVVARTDTNTPAMIAKPYGQGNVVITGDSNWAADGWIDNNNNRILATNVFRYFSNAPAGKRIPVVFLPGIMGSKLFNGNQQIWPDVGRMVFPFDHNDSSSILFGLGPIAFKEDGKSAFYSVFNSVGLKAGREGIIDEFGGQDFYTTLLNHFLVKHRYAYNKDFFIYPYDWRKEIGGKTITDLETLVNKAAASSPNGKVALVAHSMGGLVARTYIADTRRAAKVDQVITLATPYLGTPKALAGLLGKETVTTFPITEKGGLVVEAGVPPRNVTRGLVTNYPGFYALLPSLEYFTLNGGGMYAPYSKESLFGVCTECLSYADTYSRATVSNINSTIHAGAATLHSKIDSAATWNNVRKVTIIYGTGQQTIIGIAPLIAIEWGRLKTAAVFVPVTAPTGDGTVTTLSASLRGKYNRQGAAVVMPPVNADHGGLVKNAIALGYVDSALGLGPVNAPELENFAAAAAAGGVQIIATGARAIDVTDGLGNHTGPVAGLPEAEQSIPGSFYFAEDPLVSVALLSGQVYGIVITPSGIGPVDITVLKTAPDGSVTQVRYTGIPATADSRIRMNNDPYLENTWQLDLKGDSSNVSPVTPSVSYAPGAALDNTAPVSNIALAGRKNRQGWFEGNVQVTLSAMDAGSGVQRIMYAFGNNREPKLYTGPFVVDAKSVSTLYVFAVDKAGNVETAGTAARVGPDSLFLPFLTR
jgi:pimeloyl-ACP methyl ester carboxylesterase